MLLKCRTRQHQSHVCCHVWNTCQLLEVFVPEYKTCSYSAFEFTTTDLSVERGECVVIQTLHFCIQCVVIQTLHFCIWFWCISSYLFISKDLMISSFNCTTEPCQLLPEKEKEKQCLEQCTCFSARVIFYLCENTIVLTYNDRQIQVWTKVLLLLQHIPWYKELCTSIFAHWYWVLHFDYFLL